MGVLPELLLVWAYIPKVVGVDVADPLMVTGTILPLPADIPNEVAYGESGAVKMLSALPPTES